MICSAVSGALCSAVSGALCSAVFNEPRLETFNEKFNNHEDGKATKRVVDCVFK